MLLQEIAQHPKIYLVGGAVRDQLLGRDAKDKDYVVVGATPEYMEKQGYSQVGADFPVFLHPETKDEYALARTERKTGEGYHGFETSFDPSVTIEDDLERRDLTINAMAYDMEEDKIIDPFGGQEDLKKKVLRHVSEAFAEDPLRVLRVARFRSRYGYEVAPDTLNLMKKLNTELKSLTKERVWAEIEKTMTEAHADLFFDTLQKTGSMEVLFPEVKFTPRVADLLRKAPPSLELRTALLLADTPTQDAQAFIQKWKAPNNVRAIVVPYKKLNDELKDSAALTGERAVDLLQSIDAWRKPSVAGSVFKALQASGVDTEALGRAYTAASQVTYEQLSDEQKETLKGADVGNAIRDLRIAAAGQVL